MKVPSMKTTFPVTTNCWKWMLSPFTHLPLKSNNSENPAEAGRIILFPPAWGGCFSMQMGRESKETSPSAAHLQAVVLLLPLFPRHLAQEGDKENSTASSHTSSFPPLCQGRGEWEGAHGGTQSPAWGEKPNRATCTVNG